MAIDIKLKNRIESKTRRLGTKPDSYLMNLFDTLYDYPEVSTLNEYFEESERMQKASDATKKQVEEVFIMYRLVDENGKIRVDKPVTRETFSSLLTTNIKTTIKKRLDFTSKYKNNIKLVNSLVYIYGVTYLKDNGAKISDFFDESMQKRTGEMRSEFISLDSEMKELISKEFVVLMQECDYVIKSKKELKIFVDNVIEEVKYDVEEINALKNNIEIEVKNIHDLVDDILNEDKIITIPFYQREYVWTTDLMENFIKEIASNRNEILNIGNILISISSNNSNVKREFALVDGQQRLTSIILLVNYLSKSLKKINHTDFDHNLKEKVINSSSEKFINNLRNISNPSYIVTLKRLLNEPIGNYKVTSTSSCLEVNYKVVENFIDSLNAESKKNLFIKLSRILATVTYDSKSDQIELFISTNSSRKPLSNYDLIRSFLISKIPEKVEKSKLKVLDTKMNNLNSLLKFNKKGSESAEDTFFTFFLNYVDRVGDIEVSNDKDLFKRFRRTFNLSINEIEDLELLIDKITNVLESYRAVKSIDEYDGVYFDDFLLSLGNGLKTTSIYDIFLVYFIDKSRLENGTKKQNEIVNQFRRVALVIEQFEIKWKLFQFSGDSLSGALSSVFSLFVEKVNDDIEEGIYQEIYNKFLSLVQVDESEEVQETFFSRVINNDNYNKLESYIESENIKKDKIALKIINRVGFNLFNNNSIDYNKNVSKYFSHKIPTIEHIFPKSNSKWQDEDKNNAVELSIYLENIGNKFIFNKDENASAGNKTFKNKLKKYKEYNDIQLDKTLRFDKFNLLEKESWTVEDILIREKHIIESLLEIWNIKK